MVSLTAFLQTEPSGLNPNINLISFNSTCYMFPMFSLIIISFMMRYNLFNQEQTGENKMLPSRSAMTFGLVCGKCWANCDCSCCDFAPV